MMSLVRTAGKRPKSHLSLLKAGLSTVQSAFRSIGLRKENSNLSIVKRNFRRAISLPHAILSGPLLECLQTSQLCELLL